jgi:hypothetical protein
VVDLNQLCEDGDMDKFIREGQNTYRGRVACCPSGGLLAGFKLA